MCVVVARRRRAGRALALDIGCSDFAAADEIPQEPQFVSVRQNPPNPGALSHHPYGTGRLRFQVFIVRPPGPMLQMQAPEERSR